MGARLKRGRGRAQIRNSVTRHLFPSTGKETTQILEKSGFGSQQNTPPRVNKYHVTGFPPETKMHALLSLGMAVLLVNDHAIDRGLLSLQLQAKLFLNSGEERRTTCTCICCPLSVRRRPGKFEAVFSDEPRLIHD